jgi:hypothetical protein
LASPPSSSLFASPIFVAWLFTSRLRSSQDTRGQKIDLISRNAPLSIHLRAVDLRETAMLMLTCSIV